MRINKVSSINKDIKKDIGY